MLLLRLKAAINLITVRMRTQRHLRKGQFYGNSFTQYLISRLSERLLLAEATIRFLKAKLRVMQEEMDRLSCECKKKVGVI